MNFNPLLHIPVIWANWGMNRFTQIFFEVGSLVSPLRLIFIVKIFGWKNFRIFYSATWTCHKAANLLILSFYIILHHILNRMYEECSVSCRNFMFWTNFPCLHSMTNSWSGESFEFNNSYLVRKPRLWCRSCRNFKCQFATGESEPWDL